MMPGKEIRHHAVLKELGLMPSNDQNADNSSQLPNSLDLLNALLENKAVTPQVVKSTFQSLKNSRDSIKSIATESKQGLIALTPKVKHENETKRIVEDPNKQETRGKKKKKYDATTQKTYRRRHVALQVYYDGATYSGLAQNIGQESDSSVEKALFAALLKTKLIESREVSGYSRCGRTDKGVSANGQVVALQLKSRIPVECTIDQDGKDSVSNDDLPKNDMDQLTAWVPSKKSGSKIVTNVYEFPYAKMLNNVLPDTIRVLGWSPVSEDFSARFSATTRTYRYFFVRRQLDLRKMSEALQMMVGNHDFRNFCKMDVEKVYNFARLIKSAIIVEPKPERGQCDSEDVCYFEILGQAFLWHQIRCIVSILFLVGSGLESPSVVQELLNATDNPGKPSYSLAPERPLVLHTCGYPNLRIGYTAQNLWTLFSHLERQWEELVLAAARVRNRIETLKEVTVTSNDVASFVKGKMEERHKKQRRSKQNKSGAKEQAFDGGPTKVTDSLLSWGQSLKWMSKWQFQPTPFGDRELVHIPLMERSRGTTYEEKVQSLSKSKKRLKKYEDNVIKKRKTAEEDAAFYDHMTQQGGAGI